MKRRYKFYLFVLIGLVGLFTILGLLYSYLAFTPTGYRRYEVRHAEAMRRVAEQLKPALAPIPESLSGAPNKPAGDSQKAVDLMAAIIQSGKVPLPYDKEAYYHDAGKWFSEGEFNRSTRLYDEYRANDFNPNPTTSFLEPGQEARSRILDSTKDIIGQSNSFSRISIPPSLVNNEKFLKALHGTLDQVDQLLLSPSWRVPDFKDFPEPYDEIDRFCCLASLSILRATLNNDGPKAASLLARYLEALRILHFGYLERRSIDFASLSRLFCILGELDQFPREGLVRANSVLSRMVLSPQQIDDLWKAMAARRKEVLGQRLEEDMDSFRENTMHYLLYGRAECFVARTFAPIAHKRIEELTMAYGKGDRAAIARAETYLQGVTRLMNISSSLVGERFSEYVSLSTDPFILEKINLQPHAQQFTLAATLYHRDHHRYPAAIQELIPSYLDASFKASAEIGGSVMPVESFYSRPVPYTDKLITAQKIYSRFQSEQHRYPTTLEELRPYAASPAEFESFKNYFIKNEARPLFCIFQSMTWNADQLRRTKNLGGPSVKSDDEIQQCITSGRGKFKEVTVVGFCPGQPLVQEGILKVLKQSSR